MSQINEPEAVPSTPPEDEKLGLLQEWFLTFGNNTQKDLEFMSDTSAAVLQGAPTRSHRLLWVVFSFIIIAVSWANFAMLDEVTSGMGKIVPTSQIQVIQNLEGGIIAEILVKEGHLVKKGQTLIRLDDTRFLSSYKEARAQMTALQLRLERFVAEIEERPLLLSEAITAESLGLVEEELALYASRQKEFKAGMGILQQQHKQAEQELKRLKTRIRQLKLNFLLAAKELKLTAPLVKEGAVSEVEVLRLRRQVNELRADKDEAILNIPLIQAKMAEGQGKIDEYKISFKVKAQDELNKVRAELSRMTESNVALEDRVVRTAVRSPMDGTVKQIKVATIGGVIQPGMDLIEIVPLGDSLLVEAKIRPKDIAFLRPGQDAKVKFTAYDFSIYGGLDAKLEHISADTIIDENEESFYIIRVRTNESQFTFDGEQLPIIPGMIAEVDILTGKKSILSYIFKPILKAKQKALRER